MKSKPKYMPGHWVAAAMSTLLFFQSNTTVASTNNYPPIRIGLRFGYYGGYYRPLFPSYYPWGYPSIGFNVSVLPFGYIPFYYGGLPYYAYDGVYYRPYNHGYQVTVPPVGAEVPQLPSHARAITINGDQYFTLNGVYYKPETKADGSHAFIIAGKDGVLNTHITAPTQPQPQAAPSPQTAPAAPAVQETPPAQSTVQSTPEFQVAPAPVTSPVATPDALKVGDTAKQLPDGCKSVNVAGKTYFVSADGVYYEQVADGKSISYRVQGVPAPQQ